MIGSALTWEAAGSRFVLTPTDLELLHNRAFDYYFLVLQRSNLVSAAMADLHSNDGLYNFVDQITGSPVITADANGTARLTVDITFKPAAFFAAHFPYENYVGWNNGGTLSVLWDGTAATNGGSPETLTLTNAVTVNTATAGISVDPFG